MAWAAGFFGGSQLGFHALQLPALFVEPSVLFLGVLFGLLPWGRRPGRPSRSREKRPAGLLPPLRRCQAPVRGPRPRGPFWFLRSSALLLIYDGSAGARRPVVLLCVCLPSPRPARRRRPSSRGITLLKGIRVGPTRATEPNSPPPARYRQLTTERPGIRGSISSPSRTLVPSAGAVISRAAAASSLSSVRICCTPPCSWGPVQQEGLASQVDPGCGGFLQDGGRCADHRHQGGADLAAQLGQPPLGQVHRRHKGQAVVEQGTPAARRSPGSDLPAPGPPGCAHSRRWSPPGRRRRCGLPAPPQSGRCTGRRHRAC